MCTVSYIPSEEYGFILTSNRDERSARTTLAPQIYEVDGIKVAFPKDEKAGGSWIALNDKGRVCCLLNGAYKAHTKQDFHTVSRGNILTAVAKSAEDPRVYFLELDLSPVEPFTIITIDKFWKFMETIWDGKQLHHKILDPEKEYIWSSVTLYPETARAERRKWFKDFIERNQNITQEQVYDFHTGNHTDDIKYNVIMQREEIGLETLSITQILPCEQNLAMTYFDIKHNKKVEVVL